MEVAMGIFDRMFGKRNTSGASPAPGESGNGAKPASAAPPTLPRDLPQEWGWYRMHDRNGRRTALGYYYRDRHAGPSFHILAELASPLAWPPEAFRDEASAAGYRGDTTFRLGAHETINIEPIPAEFATLMRTRYERCEGPATAMLLKLTAADRAQYGLPDAPPWIAHYL